MKAFLRFYTALLLLTLVSCRQPDHASTTERSENNVSAQEINHLQSEADHLIHVWGRSENRFKIKPRHTALVVIDMQNFVCTPENGATLPRMDEVIRNTNKLVDICHLQSIPVIWVRHNITTAGDSTDGGLYADFHSSEHLSMVENGGKSTEIYSALHFNNKLDNVVFKNRYSAFLPIPSKSELQLKLTSLNIKQLIVTGVATNVCVESTIRDAMQLDYEVILIEDATSTFDDVIREASLFNIRLLFADVRQCQDVIDEINGK